MGSSSSVLLNQRNLYESLYHKIEICPLSQNISTSNDPKIYLGKVIASSQPLYSPFKQISCVYYLITVEAYYPDDKSWHIIANDFLQQNFYLVNLDNGIFSVHVPAVSSKIKLIEKSLDFQSINDASRQHIRQILKTHKIDLNTFSEDRLRWCESTLALGETVAILGRVQSSLVNGHDYKELLPISSNDFSPKWYKNHSFTQSEIDDWTRFTNSNQYICTDDPHLMKGMRLQPLPENFNCSHFIPGYNHQLMGTQHTNSRPVLSNVAAAPPMMPSQQPPTIIQPSVVSMPQPMVLQQQPMMVPQQPMMVVPIQAQPVYYQQQQQPVMPLVQSGYPMMMPSSSPQFLPQVSTQYPPSPAQYSSPVHPHTSHFQQPFSPVNQPAIQSHASINGYFPTQQPVQHRPGGYPKEPQYYPIHQSHSLPLTQAQAQPYPPTTQQHHYPQQQQQQQVRSTQQAQQSTSAAPPRRGFLDVFMNGTYPDDDNSW